MRVQGQHDADCPNTKGYIMDILQQLNQDDMNAQNDDLKAKLVSSVSYIHNMAEFERDGNLKLKISFGGLFFLIVGSTLVYCGYIPIPTEWYAISFAVAIFVIFITYMSLTGFDFNKFSIDFFNENQKIIEDSFYDELKTVDQLYIDSSLDKAIRVKGYDADIISVSKNINCDSSSRYMSIYCVFKVENTAIKVKKVVRLSKLPSGRIGLTVSDYLVTRLSSDDLVNEYKNSPDIYQKHFA